MNVATRAIEAVVAMLTDAGIPASRDAETFAAELQGIGVLVGLPSRIGGTLSAGTFTIPVYVISADPVNTEEAVDRLYAEADEAAAVLSTLGYRITTWGGRAGSEPLTAAELTVTVTVTASLEEV